MEKLINNLKSLEEYVLSKADYLKSDEGVQLWENDLECIRAGIRALKSLAELNDFAAQELGTVEEVRNGGVDSDRDYFAEGVYHGTEHLKAYIDRAYSYTLTGEHPVTRVEDLNLDGMRRWIPIEVEYTDGQLDVLSQTPDDGEEVLLSNGLTVWTDTWREEYFFEETDLNPNTVLAWMRFPKPYRR